MLKKNFILLFALSLSTLLLAQKDSTVSKKDRKKDVLLQTSMGDITIRLSDSTPLHRDNFLKLVKVGYFDSLLFHRVIKGFMIQGGDPNSKHAPSGQALGNGGPAYRIPAEFRTTLFHKKGALAAARDGNPAKESSGSQFYIAQGKTYTAAELDAMEASGRIGTKMPELYRQAYTTVGGVPHLDLNYTVFGEVISGIEVVDKISEVPTSKAVDRDRPLTDVVIVKAKLVKRKKEKKKK